MPVIPYGAPPGTTVNTLGNSTWSSANPYGTMGTDPNGTDPYTAWLNSPAGQAYNTAQEAAAAQARRQADADMANKLEKVKQDAQQIAINRGTAAANAWYQKQEAKLARDRLDQEWKIHQDEFGLEQQKYGLNVAEDYTKYASTPDQRFAASDFADAMSRLGQGLGVRPYGTAAGNPVPKSFNDFSALLGGTGAMPTASGTGYTPPAGSVDALSAGATNANGGPATPTGTGSTADPRVTAANAVMKAIPPSGGDGHDVSDQAALTAIQNIYKASAPGTLQRMLPGQQATFAAGLSRLGYYAPDSLAQMKRNGIGQGAATAA